MLVKKVIPSHPQKYSNLLYWNPYSNLPHTKKLYLNIFWSEILFTPSCAHLYCSHIILPILYMYIYEYVHIFVLFVHISIYECDIYIYIYICNVYIGSRRAISNDIATSTSVIFRPRQKNSLGFGGILLHIPLKNTVYTLRIYIYIYIYIYI